VYSVLGSFNQLFFLVFLLFSSMKSRECQENTVLLKARHFKWEAPVPHVGLSLKLWLELLYNPFGHVVLSAELNDIQLQNIIVIGGGSFGWG